MSLAAASCSNASSRSRVSSSVPSDCLDRDFFVEARGGFAFVFLEVFLGEVAIRIKPVNEKTDRRESEMRGEIDWILLARRAAEVSFMSVSHWRQGKQNLAEKLDKERRDKSNFGIATSTPLEKKGH